MNPARYGDPHPSDSLEAALAAIPHFTELSDQVKKEIASIAQKSRYQTGQVIYLEGEPAEKVYLLVSGWVKATRISRHGREQAMQFLQPVDIFGDVAVLARQPYPATVTALEPVLVYLFPAEAITHLIERHPELALAVARRMAERILYYVDLVENISLHSVEARLARTLLQHVEYRDGTWVVPRRSWTTFDVMAVRLGTVRDVLSRALKTLEAENLLRVSRDELEILDVTGLAKRGNS